MRYSSFETRTSSAGPYNEGNNWLLTLLAKTKSSLVSYKYTSYARQDRLLLWLTRSITCVLLLIY